MTSTRKEITELEEKLRQAELGPDPDFFEEILADNAVFFDEGNFSMPKKKIVEAHKPGKNLKFTDVQMSDMNITDHGDSAVVTCKGHYRTSENSFTLKFMRVWVKKNNKWQIIAGTVSK